MNSGARRHATRERIVAAEVMKLEQRQAKERAAANGAAAGRPVARAQVFVDPWPEQAFGIFVKEAGFGLRTIHWSWVQPERGRYVRLRRGPAGRFAEVYDTVTDDGYEIGRVTAWQPGARLALIWREVDWPEGVSTDVDAGFEPLFGGTLVTVEHSGFERLGPHGAQSAVEYQVAWTHALGWVAARARARGAADVSR
jgi:Activator of Hsp90 ATPase homolog 1-like protein